MKTKWLATALLASVLGGGTMLRAQTTSELLQKGIYMQETVGDLDGAIKIYQQVAQMAKESRANAAQALYRLGVCQQKKGQQAEAAKTFRMLIAEYADQADVVAQAKALVPAEAGTKLLPAPWADGEVLELGMKTANGAPAGFMRYSVQSSKTSPDQWLFETRTSTLALQYLTRVEADKETMKPVSSAWTNLAIIGDVQITYRGAEARIEKKGKDAKTITLDGGAWDNEEAMWVMRRLPLAPGYKTTLPVVSPVGIVVKLGLTVTGAEDVQTPVGRFHCYRFDLDTVNQTFWISTDSNRYLVKFDTGPVSAELRSIGRLGTAQAQATYRNERLGYSIVTPAGWSVENYDATGSKENSLVQLIDPDSFASIKLSVRPVKSDEIPAAAAMRAEAEKELGEQQQGKKVRADSWQIREINGHPAVSWVVDFPDAATNQDKVQYTVRVRGGSTRAEIEATATPQDFDSLRARMDPIIDTLTLK